MRSHACILVLAALAQGCARSEPTLSPAHAAAIGDSVGVTLAAYRTASAAGRWDSLLTFYADDPNLRWVEEGKVVADSIADFRREFAGLAPGLRIETEYTGMVIAPLAPGAASVVTGFNTRFVDSTGTKFGFGGTMTVVMVHRGARWQFLTGHSSAPANHATP
jgi:hypothetical protein